MESPQTQYRILHLLVEHGDKGVVAVTAGALMIGLLAVFLTGAFLLAPVVLIASALLYIVARSYIELVRVIVDMLLPK